MIDPKNKIGDDYITPYAANRFEMTIQWLQNFKLEGNFLEIGDRSPFSEMIEKEFKISIRQNTDFDLDYCKVKFDKKFDNILFFEVVEHLLNPLLFMEWTHKHLKNDGRVYLSTPVFKPKWMRDKTQHFHEFNINELEFLIFKSGFKIVDKKIINPNPWYWLFKGLRPFLRFIGFQRTILLCLQKAD